MAKQIKDFQVEVKTDVETMDTSAFVRYHVDNTVDNDCTKYGELSIIVAEGDTLTTVNAAVVVAINTKEGIT